MSPYVSNPWDLCDVAASGASELIQWSVIFAAVNRRQVKLLENNENVMIDDEWWSIDVSWFDYWWLISDDDRYIIYIHISYYIMIYPSCGYVTGKKQNIEPNRTTQTHQKHPKTCFSMLMLHLLICWLILGNDTLQLLHIPNPKRKRTKITPMFRSCLFPLIVVTMTETCRWVPSR